MNRKKVFLAVDIAAVLAVILAVVLSLVLKNRAENAASSDSSDSAVSESVPSGVTETVSAPESGDIPESSGVSEVSSVSDKSEASTAEESVPESELSAESSKIPESEESAPPVAETKPDEQNPAEPKPDEQNPDEQQPDEPEESAPEWTEMETGGELFVNTDGIWSRISALMGSTPVNQYSLNDKVTVTAITDTDYYKLEDGTFIHCDYLSETEIKIPETPITIAIKPADYTSTTPNGYTIERRDGITYVDGIMIANKTYTLPADYNPGTQPDAYNAFTNMQSAAAEDGVSLFIASGYRSYYDQDAIYARYVYNDGVEVADTYSSRPGHSDHQTGYTFDLNSFEQSFGDTKEGKWLAANCADYGFIIRYPKGKDAYTGYMYEPWHVRYIGVEKARAITESGLSLEEYYGITSDYADCTD